MHAVPVHYLRPNETVWTPPVVACLDTETTWSATAAGQVHALRCWAAHLEVRRARKTGQPGTEDDDGTDPSDLALTIDAWTRTHRSVWLYAHNLAFDLTTSQLAGELGRLGWEVTEFAVDSPAPFVRMARGTSHLTMADSFSWLPASIDVIAGRLGMAKLALPGDGDDLATWLARCRQDVAILAAAMHTLMSWWESARLGRWSLTGVACGWNAMRHQVNPRRILIHPGQAGIAADRAAIYGGRRSTWRTGPLPPGRYAELDFESAYPRIAAALPLPHERMAAFTSLPAGHPWVTSERHSIIARVRIVTATPRWPCRAGGRVWYPVGDFTTTLAGPDIAEAARLGCLREIGPGHVHRLGYALAPWARWILAAAAGADHSVPPVAALTLKHWGRAVIGKWAQHGFTTTEIGPAPTSGWDAVEGWNHTRGARAAIIDFGGRRWQATADGTADNCYPAVLAFVEAHVRVRLGRVLEQIPRRALVCADTDGLIADLATFDGWELDAASVKPLTMRVKSTYASVEVIGPQHLILDGKRRFAGVPASATASRDGTLTALLWPKLAWQMGHGRPGEYVRPVQSYRIAGTYAPGWVTTDGRVVPLEMRPAADGTNRILPWPLTSWALLGAQLAETQNKYLEGYRGT